MKAKFKDCVFNVVNSIILIIFAFLCAYPFYYIIINSLSDSSAIDRGVYFIPRGFTLAYYQQLSKISDISNSVFISAARTVVGTFITLLASTLMGYLVTKKELPFRKFIYRAVIITMYFSSGLIPWYILMKNIHLKNTFWLYVIPSAVSAFYIILVKTYIESLPASMEESAEMDGAGVFTVFFRIVVPLCLPILACVVIFSAVGQWNSWADNLYLVSNNKLNTLQYLLYINLKSNMANLTGSTALYAASAMSTMKITPTAIRLAMTVVTVTPILLVYPFMQKYFVKGIMMGAIKG